MSGQLSTLCPFCLRLQRRACAVAAPRCSCRAPRAVKPEHRRHRGHAKATGQPQAAQERVLVRALHSLTLQGVQAVHGQSHLAIFALVAILVRPRLLIKPAAPRPATCTNALLRPIRPSPSRLLVPSRFSSPAAPSCSGSTQTYYIHTYAAPPDWPTPASTYSPVSCGGRNSRQPAGHV